MRKIKEVIKKIPRQIQLSLLLVFSPVVVYTIFGFFLGSIISLFDSHDSYLHNVYVMAAGGYIYFGGAALSLSGLLQFLVKPTMDVPIGFGPGLYYGTFFLASLLQDYVRASDFVLYCISGTIVSLICYIIWLKNFKSKHSDEDK